jgi:hypothetical protein
VEARPLELLSNEKIQFFNYKIKFMKKWDDQRISFKLSTGRIVDLVSFAFQLTYDGFLEGQRNEKMNKMAISNIECPPHWDKECTYLEAPDDITKELPVFVGFAEFISFEGIKDKDNFSKMNYIWFFPSIEELSIRAIIEDILPRLDWENQANECNVD